MSVDDFVRRFVVAERRRDALECFERERVLPPEQRRFRALEDAIESVDVEVRDDEVQSHIAHSARRLATGRAIISRYGVEWSSDPVGAETIQRMTRRAEFQERLLIMLSKQSQSAV